MTQKIIFDTMTKKKKKKKKIIFDTITNSIFLLGKFFLMLYDQNFDTMIDYF